MRKLLDGEEKVMRSDFPDHDNEIKVAALRIDSETPYIILTDRDGNEVCLTDVGAQSLIERVQKALAILPSSK